MSPALFGRSPPNGLRFRNLYVVVSIDGLQPEHDERRKPATYERILKNIAAARVTIHSTITSKIAGRPGYLDEFLRFWSARAGDRKGLVQSLHARSGARPIVEILTPAQRVSVIEDLRRLRLIYPILDMPPALIDEMSTPPKSPEECIFARTTQTISADLTTAITPCQFGGDPDCEQCGCIASMGLAAVGHHRVLGGITAGQIFLASDRIGKTWKKVSRPFRPSQLRPSS